MKSPNKRRSALASTINRTIVHSFEISLIDRYGFDITFISRLATPLMLFRYPIFGIAVTIGMLPIATFMENQVSLWLIVITLLGIKCIIEQIVFTSAMMLVQFCLN